jgi:regulator of replication initiation timing
MLDTQNRPDTDMPVPNQDLPGVCRQEPLNFWQVQSFFACPVVGMCLTQAEQQQLLKKCGFSPKKCSAFELHETLVASSESDNRVSRRVDRLLQRKYGKQASELLALDHETFMSRFKSAMEAGEHAAVLWAAAIHPSLSIAHRREVFGDIHMAMHWSGGQRMMMQRKLEQHKANLEKARQHIKQIAQERRLLQSENETLKKSQARLKAALESEQNEKRGIEAARDEHCDDVALHEMLQQNRQLQCELEILHNRLSGQQQRIAVLQADNQRLSDQLSAQGNLTRRVTEETRTILAAMVPLNRCDASCPSFDLCQKRILIVGGISRMASLYRELVESSGGVFEYHDGHMKKGAHHLETRLKRADVVICPVSCNSHAACSIVKNLAKKHKKTVHMLANSSLKSVSEAIWGENNGGRTVN